MFWTDERVGSLKKLSSAGLSPVQIADQLSDGSRIDVIGEARTPAPSSTALVPAEIRKYTTDNDVTAPPLLLRRSVREQNPLAIYLTIYTLERLVRELLPFYGLNCPIAIVLGTEGSGGRIVRGTFASIEGWTAKLPVEPATLVLVG